MTAAKYNEFTIEQGATFSEVVTYKPGGVAADLTGYTARMQLRKNYDADTTILDLTTENSRITLGGVAGTIALTIAAADTSGIMQGVYVYDLELVNGSIVSRILQGSINITREVTR